MNKKTRKINDTRVMIFGEQSPNVEKSISTRTQKMIGDDHWIQNSSKLDFQPEDFKAKVDLSATPNIFVNEDSEQHHFLRTGLHHVLPARPVSSRFGVSKTSP